LIFVRKYVLIKNMQIKYQEEQPKRLDVFLAKQLDDTRSQIKKNIQSGNVLINKKPAKPHTKLKQGDAIKIIKQKAETISTKTSTTETTQAAPEPKIMAETDDYIILEKPAGLLVHATLKNETNTLANWLAKKYPELEKIADPESLKRDEQIFRPGIVHRLDKDVSGVMLIARNQNAFEYFKKLFQKRDIKKEYLALVHDHLPQTSGIIDFEISRSSSGEKMASHPHGSGKGKPALTEYEVLKKFLKFDLVKINIKTGRTNQIRVHLFALGNPIAGDRRYTNKKFKERKQKTPFSRLFLHANTLEFTDRQGELQTYESPLPGVMDKVINGLQ